MEPPPSAKKAVRLPGNLHRSSSSVLHSLLIVEDDESHIELMRRAFQAQPDSVNLMFARTLKGAKQMILAHAPDMIIADWLPPDGKGVEMITHIEASSKLTEKAPGKYIHPFTHAVFNSSMLENLWLLVR